MKLKRRRLVVRHTLMMILLVVFGIYFAMIAMMNINNNRAVTAIKDIHDSYCREMIDFGPEITLNGTTEAAVIMGNEYHDAGFLVDDYCEVAATKIIGEVDTSKPGTYALEFRATDIYGHTETATRTVKVLPSNRGIIYLTFDDGPGPYTAELLDVLAKYKVKATFFVTGAGDDGLIKREYNEGHAVGLHTLSHDYAYVYSSVDNFFADLYAVQDRVKSITGYTSTLMRFPGGSSNTVSARYDGGARIMSKLTREVEKRGFTYYDWNISSGDAGETTSTDQVFENVVTRLVEGGSSVVLQHDVKGFSVAAVERIIKYALDNGWTFAKLESNSFAAHHGINN